LRLGAAGTLVIVVASNLAISVHDRLSETPHLSDAREVASILKPPDLAVTGWDDISQLYEAFWGRDHNFDVPTLASTYHGETVRLLEERVRRTQTSGGRIYFLGVLDLGEDNWEAFLGARAGLSYHALTRFRRCSRTIKTFPYRNSAITLRLFDESSVCSDLH
jgi:hypothetical protein